MNVQADDRLSRHPDEFAEGNHDVGGQETLGLHREGRV